MAADFDNRLKQKGIRPTAMRILVLKYLLEQDHTYIPTKE